MTSRPAIAFVVESGTDVRLVEGLAARASLTVIARRIPGGVEISRPPAAAVDIRTGPPGRAAFAAWVTRLLLAEGRRWDHLLIQGYGPAALAACGTARLIRRPTTLLVCSPTESYYRCRRVNPVPGKPYRALEETALVQVARLTAHLAGAYVVLSEYLGAVVRGHGARCPVQVVPVYGVDTARFAPSSRSRAEVRRRLELPADGALLFYSSRVAPEKDTRSVLGALRILVAEGKDVRLLHRSGGYRELLALAEREGVADRIIATDAVHPEHDLPDSYRAADLCVQASLDEGLGFSPLEALACGTPVVASAVGGLRETVVDGRTGWTVPPGDAGALARVISAALADPAEAARRAAEGRRMVQERYGREKVFDRLFEVLAAPR